MFIDYKMTLYKMKRLFTLSLIILMTYFFVGCSTSQKTSRDSKKEVLTESDVEVPEDSRKAREWKDLTKDEKKKQNKAVNYANEGNKELIKGDYGDAIDNFNSAIEEWPDLADAYIGLGNAYYKDSQFQEAINAFNTYITYNSKKKDVYYTTGSCYKKLGDNQNALKNFIIVTKLDSKDAVAHLEIANIYFEEQAYNESLDSYESVHDLNKTLLQPYQGMGNIYIKFKNYDKAIKILEQGLKIKEDRKMKEILAMARGLKLLGKGREEYNDDNYQNAEKLL